MDALKDHQLAALVNTLRDIAVEYHGTQQLRERIARAVRAALPSDAAQAPIARALGEWHEDHGNAVWFTWQDGEWLGEPSWIGQPDDSDWPGYHTHWIPHPAFPAPVRTYTTQPGESVAGIALRQCGNETQWRSILECNPEFEDLLANDYFPIGTVLMLPSIAAPVASAAAAPGEDAYVAQRMSETLAEVWATIMGNDAQPEDESLNAIERVKKAAQVLRLEVDLHRAQRNEAPFQARVQPWMMECFGPMIAGDREERNHRFLEESLELVQACGCTASEAHQLVDYVFGRPVGEPHQEVGGVMVTLAALCLANGLDMHADGETELARISVPETVAKIRAKQAAKPKHSPLPEATVGISEDRSGALCDMHYSRGLQAGFTLGQMGDNEGLRETPRPAQLGERISSAARDVLAERARQVNVEGWTPAHDDQHEDEDLILAAIVYAESAVGYHMSCPDTWPWAPKWFKPTTQRRDLEKAGALILAAMERIDRAGGEA